MHACLGVEEIRLAICNALAYYDANMGKSLIDTPSLAALARTCQLFHEQATDVLWREQTSLSQLVKVISSDLWEIQLQYQIMFMEEVPVVVLHGTPSGEDWKRVEYYGGKIRDLYLTSDIGIDMSTFSRITRDRPTTSSTTHLLPRLQSLTLPCGETCDFLIPYLPSLLVESISQLCIIHPASHRVLFPGAPIIDTRYQPLMDSIRQSCQNLTTLMLLDKISGFFDTTSSNFSASAFVASFRSLQTLYISLRDIDPPMMTSIGHLPRLQQLNIGVSRDTYGSNSGRIPSLDFGNLDILPAFSSPETNLQDLRVRFIQDPDLKRLLRSVHSSLKKVMITSIYTNDSPEGVISPLLRFTNLTKVQLDYFNTFQYPSEAEPSPLFSVLSLHQLRYVEFHGFPDAAWTNAWIEEATSAWPLLEYLSLLPKTKDSSEPFMSLEGLIPIARHCKYLRELKLKVLCHPFDVSMLSYEHGVSNLARLTIRGPLEQPLRVLRCITLMFPKLKLASGPDEEGWKDLNQYFKESFY